MNTDELLENSYELRSLFIKDLTKIITNIKDKSLLSNIYSLYYHYLEEIIDDDYKELFSSYYTSIQVLEKFPRGKIKANKFLLVLIYEMICNISNAYVSLMYEYGHEDAKTFFLGFNIYESKMDLDCLKEECKKAPNDLEILELVDCYNEEDLQYILNKDYLDMYIFTELSNYEGPTSLMLFYERFIFLVKQIDFLKNEPIYKFIIKLLKEIKQ